MQTICILQNKNNEWIFCSLNSSICLFWDVNFQSTFALTKIAVTTLQYKEQLLLYLSDVSLCGVYPSLRLSDLMFLTCLANFRSCKAQSNMWKLAAWETLQLSEHGWSAVNQSNKQHIIQLLSILVPFHTWGFWHKQSITINIFLITQKIYIYTCINVFIYACKIKILSDFLVLIAA